jgi:hypothetical protein
MRRAARTNQKKDPVGRQWVVARRRARYRSCKRATRLGQHTVRIYHSGCRTRHKSARMLHEIRGTALLSASVYFQFSRRSPLLLLRVSDASVSSAARLRFPRAAPGIQLDRVATLARQNTNLLFLLGSCLQCAASRTSTPASHVRRTPANQRSQRRSE